MNRMHLAAGALAAALLGSQAWAVGADARAPELRMPDLRPMTVRLAGLGKNSPDSLRRILFRTQEGAGRIGYDLPRVGPLARGRALDYLQRVCADLEAKGATWCRAFRVNVMKHNVIRQSPRGFYAELHLAAYGPYDVLRDEAKTLLMAERYRFRFPLPLRERLNQDELAKITQWAALAYPVKGGFALSGIKRPHTLTRAGLTISHAIVAEAPGSSGLAILAPHDGGTSYEFTVSKDGSLLPAVTIRDITLPDDNGVGRVIGTAKLQDGKMQRMLDKELGYWMHARLPQ